MAAMIGAKTPVTFPIRVMPPMITAPMIAAATRPVTRFGMPKLDRIVSARVLA